MTDWSCQFHLLYFSTDNVALAIALTYVMVDNFPQEQCEYEQYLSCRLKLAISLAEQPRVRSKLQIYTKQCFLISSADRLETHLLLSTLACSRQCYNYKKNIVLVTLVKWPRIERWLAIATIIRGLCFCIKTWPPYCPWSHLWNIYLNKRGRNSWWPGTYASLACLRLEWR